MLVDRLEKNKKADSPCPQSFSPAWGLEQCSPLRNLQAPAVSRRRQREASVTLPGTTLVGTLLCPFQGWTAKQSFVRKSTCFQFASQSSCRCKLKGSWLGSSPCSLVAQPTGRAAELQTVEQAPAPPRAHSRPLSRLTLAPSAPSGAGRAGYSGTGAFRFLQKEGMARGVIF